MATEESETSVTPAVDASTTQEKHLSYAKAVKSGPSLSVHVLDMGMVEGKEVVQVPDDVIQDTVPLWDDLLEGRFLAPAPHVAKIHIIVNKIWPLGDQSIKIDVFPVNEVTVKFRIKDMATRKRILRRGMWNIANIPMILSKWSPVVEEEEEEEIKVVPMWITMKNVPHKMFSWKGLGFIASAVGKPKRLHPDTILCTSFEEAKVFVEADMTKELPKSHRFKSKLGVDAEVDFIYPWLPDKCSICTKWGHTHKTCKSRVKLLTRRDDSEPAVQNVTLITSVTETINVDSATRNTGKEVATVLTETDTAKGGASPNKVYRKEARDVVAINESSRAAEKTSSVTSLPADIEGNWRDVSPSKHRWQGTKPAAEHTTVISPSRFAILLEEGNNDELERKDELEEGHVSNDVTEEGCSSNEKEREEGEILEAPEEALKEVSIEVPEEDSEEDTGTDDHLNTSVRKPGK
ncbi:hypothetical protein Bca52824_060618 [Brassica carinata]|uniref:DUF4283 domain-containing protein n=1 Tax=Brassica carinata TaxID=52824 RepID=A0A8X7QWH5_BRACI|nr:hypothetical protein Bca52824_060618 [Brassica carinata]